MDNVAAVTEAVAEKPALGEIWTTGRRKTAIARVKITQGNGKIKVNGDSVDGYFGSQEKCLNELARIFKFIPKDKIDVLINVVGGGVLGQIGAIKHGLARGLSEMDPSLRPKLKAEGFMRRDPRMVERKKPGQPKARKKFQWTKR